MASKNRAKQAGRQSKRGGKQGGSGASRPSALPSHGGTRTRVRAVSVSLTEARAQLSTLVGQASPRGPLTAITVRDELKAYLVTPEQLDALVAAERQEQYSAQARRPRLRGTLRIVDDLEAASGEAHDSLLKGAMDSASEEEPEQ